MRVKAQRGGIAKGGAPMTTQHFNAPEILQQIRQRRAIKRRRQFQHSRLTRVRAELVALRRPAEAIVNWPSGSGKLIASKSRIPQSCVI